MKSGFRNFILLFLILPMCSWSSKNDPWFSGPLFENHPVSMPLGKGFIDFSSNSVENRGFFDASGNFVPAPRVTIDDFSMDVAYGLSQNTDFRLNLQYIRNLVSGVSFSRIGDTLMTVGYQVFRQNDNSWLPDFRVTIEEIFPTGTWDNLNPDDHGADATGTGSFQTSIGFRLRKMIALPSEHFLVLHGRFLLTHPSPVPISGYSIYGGSPTTQGTLTLGNSALVDLAVEYNFTRNWGGVFEWSIYTQGGSDFSGELSDTGYAGVLPKFIFSSGPKGAIPRRIIHSNSGSNIIYNNLMPSKLNLGKPFIGNGNNLSSNIAPAIEYNFSDSFGIVGGPYFNFMGRNTPVFMSAVVTIFKNW